MSDEFVSTPSPPLVDMDPSVRWWPQMRTLILDPYFTQDIERLRVISTGKPRLDSDSSPHGDRAC